MSLGLERAELLAEVEDRYQDAMIIRRMQNARVLLRRRNTNPRLRERLEQRVLELQQEAHDRGIEPRGYRPFPRRDRSLTFGYELDRRGLALIEPEPERRHKRPLKPQRKTGGELLDAVEQQLAASLAALS